MAGAFAAELRVVVDKDDWHRGCGEVRSGARPAEPDGEDLVEKVHDFLTTAWRRGRHRAASIRRRASVDCYLRRRLFELVQKNFFLFFRDDLARRANTAW